jgi:hypothetical protein
MKVNVEQRIQELEESLFTPDTEPNAAKRLALNIEITWKTLLKALSEAHAEPDFKDSEMQQAVFNRYHLPPLIGKWLLFHERYQFECRGHFLIGEKRRQFLEDELQRMTDFFARNSEFLRYCHSGNTEMDADLFTKNNEDPYPDGLPEKDLFAARLNPASVIVGCMLAFEQYAELLRKELTGVTMSQGSEEEDMRIEYKGTLIELVELGMSMWVPQKLFVNGKPATHEYFENALGKIYNTPIKNWSVRANQLKDNLPELARKNNERFKLLYDHLDQLPEDRPRKKTR